MKPLTAIEPLGRVLRSVLLAIALFAGADVWAATYVSRATGNWNATATWAELRTGTITTQTISPTVNGVGTNFTGELAIGNLLYRSDGALLGTIQSIGSATVLTLTGNAASSNTGIAYFRGATATPVAGDTATVNTHTVTVSANAAATNLTISSDGTLTQTAASLALSGTLNIGGNMTTNNTLSVGGATGITGTLTFSGTGGTHTFTGPVTVDGTWNNSGNENVTINGNLTRNGTFTQGTGTYTFSGAAAQTISGASGGTITFANLTLNNTAAVATRQLILNNQNLTVTGTLTLTAGRITTGASNVYVSNGSAIASAGGNDFVEGNLRKPFSGAALSRVFEVGNRNAVAPASKYTPVTLTFGAVGVAGDITISTSNADHPQFASSGLDVANHLNRYWAITNSGVTFTTYTLTLNYIAGAPPAGDIDAAATAAAFVAVRYDGTNWNATTLNAVPTTTQMVLTGLTAVGDFAVGEALGYNGGTLGRFNAYDAGAGASVHGYIRTKVAATAFTLTIAHLTAGALAAATGNVTVDLLDGSPAQGALTNNCSANWTTVIATRTIAFAGTTTLTVTFPASGAGSVPDAWTNVRVRATGTSGTVVGQIGCSADAFAIRPASLASVSVTDNDWETASPATTRTLNNVAATGGNVHKAGRPFRISATALNGAGSPATTTNYNGTPTGINVTRVLPTGGECPACTPGTVGIGSWSASSGVVTTLNATYSEAGSINMQLEDQSWANVDRADTSPASRYFSSAAFNVGRFVPDHFDITTTGSTPTFQTFGVADGSCQTPPSGPKRSFTYIGQSFGYVTAPIATFTGKNFANSTTSNYTGSLVHTSGITALQTYTPGSATLTATVGTPTIAAGTAGSGTGTVTINSADSFKYVRSATTPQSVFSASISLEVSVSDASDAGTGQGTIITTSTGTFSGIGFDSGSEFRFGRLRLLNAGGPAVGPAGASLTVPIQTEYWNGSAFTLNSQDHCTTLNRNNIALESYAKNLNACETIVTANPVTFVVGVGSLTMPLPGAANDGSVTLRPQLGLTASGDYCNSVGGGAAGTTAAQKSYLQGKWTGVDYDQNPSARAAFGVYGAQPRGYIFFRENY